MSRMVKDMAKEADLVCVVCNMERNLKNIYPDGMEEYLEIYGWHFSKKMCEWAVSRMYKVVNGKKEPIKPYTKEDLESFLEKQQISISKVKGYDHVYIANMCKADFLGSSIPDEQHLAKYVGDVINDPDGYDELPFSRFYADCITTKTPIIWADMI